MRVCPFCIITKGVKGTEIVEGGERDMDDDEKWFNHFEEAHGRIVVRKGETKEQARERCAKKGIVADRNECQCEDCKRLRMEINNKKLSGGEEK